MNKVIVDEEVGSLTFNHFPERAALPGLILVVDDDDIFLEFTARILIRAGYRVDTASNGYEGWEALNTTSYDLLITDYRMPDFSGLELIRKLRSLSLSLPCILVSSELPADREDLDKLVQPGAAFEKSVSLVQLFPKIRELLQASKFPDLSVERSRIESGMAVGTTEGSSGNYGGATGVAHGCG